MDKFRKLIFYGFLFLRKKIELLYYLYTTLNTKIIAWILSIELGSGCKFYGNPYFNRASNSVVKIGKKCRFRSNSISNLIGINRPCVIFADKGAEINIGNNCGFSGTVIGAFVDIHIGDNVNCGANTLITDGDWHNNDPRSGIPKRIIIGDNVWLGVNVTVLKGSIIGENSLIGAGSIVSGEIPSNVIAVGNPCKVIKKLYQE